MRKNTVLLIVFLLSIFTGQAQRLDTLSGNAQQQYKSYMLKRSSNKTMGWVMLGMGVGLSGGYLLMNFSNGWNGPNKGEGMFEAGAASALLSIPFFIMAGQNKRKAKLILKGERLTSGIRFTKPSFPAISLRLNL